MTSRAVVCLALGAGLVLAACGNKKKGSSGPLPINGLEALPRGTRVVIGVNVERLLTSRLVRRGVSAMLDRDAELKSRVEGIIEECKLEPGEDVESLIVGIGEGPSDLILVVRGRFEENALAACVQKRLTEGGGRLTTKPIEGRTSYRADGGAGEEPVWFALGSPTTLIVSGSEAWLAKGLGSGPRLTEDAEARAMLASAATDASVWAVGWVPGEVAKQLETATNGAVLGPERMSARLDLEGGVSAELSATMASGEDANALKLLAEMQHDGMVAVAQRWGLGRLLSKLKVEAKAKRLILAISVDEQEVSDLLAAVDSAGGSTQNPPSPDPADAGPTPATPDASGVKIDRKN